MTVHSVNFKKPIKRMPNIINLIINSSSMFIKDEPVFVGIKRTRNGTSAEGANYQ